MPLNAARIRVEATLISLVFEFSWTDDFIKLSRKHVEAACQSNGKIVLQIWNQLVNVQFMYFTR